MSRALDLVKEELRKQLADAPEFGIQRVISAHTIGVLAKLVEAIEAEEKKMRRKIRKVVRRQ